MRTGASLRHGISYKKGSAALACHHTECTFEMLVGVTWWICLHLYWKNTTQSLAQASKTMRISSIITSSTVFIHVQSQDTAVITAFQEAGVEAGSKAGQGANP
jgi:hypothetical protein